MKAIFFNRYGPPDVLQFTEVAKPSPKADEVLVKVFAASANPADWRTMRATPFLARLTNGMLKPRNPRLGVDVAGRVEAVGNAVTQFRANDEVFGCLPLNAMGSFAEYVCIQQNALALKPANMTFEQAAAVPLAALTALQGLRDTVPIQSGHKVLINGASGGVGTFAVQIAKSLGAEVTGVCSTRNLELVRSIGADHVIDYTREDFAKTGQGYDFIYCAVGNRTLADYERALSPRGVNVIAGFTNMRLMFEYQLLGPRKSQAGGKRLGIIESVNLNSTQDLAFLKALLEAGKIVPIIDKCYPLSETAEALRYLEMGHSRGKVVLSVAQ